MIFCKMSSTSMALAGITRRALILPFIKAPCVSSAQRSRINTPATAVQFASSPLSIANVITKKYSTAITGEVGDVYRDLTEQKYTTVSCDRKTYMFASKSTQDGNQKILKFAEKSNNRTSNLFIGFAAVQEIVQALRGFEITATDVDDVPENVLTSKEEFKDPSELPEAEPDTVYVQDSYNPTRYFRLRLRKNRVGIYIEVIQNHFPGYTSPFGRGSMSLIDIKDLPRVMKTMENMTN